MIRGDISNNMFYTAAFDFRLFLDIEYPLLFSIAVSLKLKSLVGLFCKINKTQLLNLKQNMYDNKVIVVTHPTLQDFLNSIPDLNEYEIDFISGAWEIAHKDYRVLYTPDLSWVTVYPNMAMYVPKVGDFMPKNKFQAKLFGFAETTLKRFMR